MRPERSTPLDAGRQREDAGADKEDEGGIALELRRNLLAYIASAPTMIPPRMAAITRTNERDESEDGGVEGAMERDGGRASGMGMSWLSSEKSSACAGRLAR